MKTIHYLIVDKYNPNKGHHITIMENGEMFYNQAIKNERHNTKPGVPGNQGWYDYYENEPVTRDGNHGYQEYINEAWEQWTVSVLHPGDTIGHWFNQAEREVDIIATLDGEALGVYEMPNGRVFFTILDSHTRQFKRTQAARTMPKKWFKQAEKQGQLEWLNQVIDEVNGTARA